MTDDWWNDPIRRAEEIELRRGERLDALPFRAKLARFWWIYWPVIAVLVGLTAVTAGLVLWLS